MIEKCYFEVVLNFEMVATVMGQTGCMRLRLHGGCFHVAENWS